MGVVQVHKFVRDHGDAMSGLEDSCSSSTLGGISGAGSSRRQSCRSSSAGAARAASGAGAGEEPGQEQPGCIASRCEKLLETVDEQLRAFGV